MNEDPLDVVSSRHQYVSELPILMLFLQVPPVFDEVVGAVESVE